MYKFIKKTFDRILLLILRVNSAHLFSTTQSHSNYTMAKGMFELKIVIFRLLKNIFLLCLAVTSASFGLESFLLPNHFIDGGATGIALLASVKFDFALPILIILINIPFIFMGFRLVSRSFAIKSAAAIAGVAICLTVFTFPELTKDKLLVAVFGGFFLGAGIGLAVRGGAVIDGTEVLAIYLSRKLGVSMGDIVIAINIVIYSTAAYVFDIETAMYSMITYLSASKTLDFVVEGIEEYVGVTIVSSHYSEMKVMVANTMGRGITLYRGKRAFGKRGINAEIDIVYTVVTRLELNKLTTEIKKIDPNAFVVMSSVKDTIGGILKKKPIHKLHEK